MARTVAQAIAAARVLTNDNDPDAATAPELYRQPDSSYLGWCLDALNAARNLRPDLFLGNYGDLAALTTSASLPIADQFFQAIVNFMVGMAELPDDEHVNSGRAKVMHDLLQGFLR